MTTKKIFKTKDLVDAESYTSISAFTRAGLSRENLPSLRNFKIPSPPIDSTGVTIITQNLPPRDGAPSVKVAIYYPTGNTSLVPAYLYIHGGGYVMGNSDMAKDRSITLVKECGAVVVCVDYRLAPESSKMDLVEDCYTALLWMHEHGSEFHIDKDRLAFGGTSAGGGLSAALALLTRDRKVIKPIFQFLEYPMLDDRTCLRSVGDLGEYIWSNENNHFGWSSLLGDIPIGAPDTSCYIVPARATDLSGLPPAYILVGALDLFLDEDIEYARRLIHSGVPTELIVYPGLVHGGNYIAPGTQLSERIQRNSLDALRKYLSVKTK